METTEIIETTERLSGAVNNSGNFYVIIFYYIFALLIIIGGLIFIRKYLMKNVKKLSGGKSGAHMRIIDRIVISQDKHIILIAAGNKILIIGVGPQKIETLAEFSKEEFGDIAENNGGADADGGGFLAMLGKKLNFRDGGKNDEDKREK